MYREIDVLNMIRDKISPTVLEELQEFDLYSWAEEIVRENLKKIL